MATIPSDSLRNLTSNPAGRNSPAAQTSGAQPVLAVDNAAGQLPILGFSTEIGD
ncbi:hypothetical protein L902_00595 [Agrobacterium radiobacter DSM 30147]|nr:hypothetical protein L902_00595 [Agrobacterium radiobacter DSM 30147]